MILVTLGTQDKSFKRLLKSIDKEIENKNIKEEVIVQAGYTKFKSNNMKIFDLVSPRKLDSLMKDASIIITHGGVGSILGALKYNKPVIAAARLSRYREHTNDHQKQIVKEFAKRGYLIELKDFSKLSEALKIAKKFKPVKYKSNNKEFKKLISSYIDEDYTSWWNKYKYFILLIIIILIIFLFMR